jgi:hypothetical protein
MVSVWGGKMTLSMARELFDFGPKRKHTAAEDAAALEAAAKG